jgi:hypothetical protein
VDAAVFRHTTRHDTTREATFAFVTKTFDTAENARSEHPVGAENPSGRPEQGFSCGEIGRRRGALRPPGLSRALDQPARRE